MMFSKAYSTEACCTCARLLHTVPTAYSEHSEKPLPERRLECCGRTICAHCQLANPRFQTYCPFCQVSTTPSSLPQGLRDPPAYSPPSSPRLRARREMAGGNKSENGDDPPAYDAHGFDSRGFNDKKVSDDEPAPDVLHFVDPNNDTINSLSLRYGVPAQMLRNTNNLFSDNLLAARRTILIPGTHYKGGVSLSPRPPDGEEEELRKSKIRKFMTTCKVSDYDVAVLYLNGSQYDLEIAIDAYQADERWEKEHPLEASKKKGKAKAKSRSKWFGGGGLTGQI